MLIRSKSNCQSNRRTCTCFKHKLSLVWKNTFCTCLRHSLPAYLLCWATAFQTPNYCLVGKRLKSTNKIWLREAPMAQRCGSRNNTEIEWNINEMVFRQNYKMCVCDFMGHVGKFVPNTNFKTSPNSPSVHLCHSGQHFSAGSKCHGQNVNTNKDFSTIGAKTVNIFGKSPFESQVDNKFDTDAL